MMISVLIVSMAIKITAKIVSKFRSDSPGGACSIVSLRDLSLVVILSLDARKAFALYVSSTLISVLCC